MVGESVPLIFNLYSSDVVPNIVPNFIHIMKEGKIIKTGDKTLAKQIEKEGFQSF